MEIFITIKNTDDKTVSTSIKIIDNEKVSSTNHINLKKISLASDKIISFLRFFFLWSSSNIDADFGEAPPRE